MRSKKFQLPNLTFSKKYFKENIIKILLIIAAVIGIIVIFSILFFLVKESYPLPTDLWTFLSGEKWRPTSVNPRFGAFPLIVGTLLVTLGAMVFAVPLSIGSAIFISEIASPRIRAIIKPVIELLAGIPSVVYGFFGLIILVDLIHDGFNVPTGETWLAGSIILGIMAIPTITSVAEDAINAVPRHYKEGSLAMGATRWQTIRSVVLPSALSGITAAIILGIGRAVGETMAVMMICGNSAVIPTPLWNVFSPIRTLTSTLGIEIGEVPFGSGHYHALFGVAVLLLAITLVINISAVYVLGKIKEKQMALGKKKRKTIVSAETMYKIKRYLKHILIGVLLLFLYFVGGLILVGTIVVFAIVLYFVFKKLSQKNIQKISFSIITVAIIIVLCILGILLGYIISNGIGTISWEFLTTPHSNLGRQGGVVTAILGTLYLAAGAIAIALPIGVGAAIYLVEYKKEGEITKIIRNAADLLNGTPSIVFGLFGFAFLVLFLGWGRVLFAGQLTLAFMIIPTVLRTSEEALKSVPQSIREGSLAVGATRWQTIKRVVLPPASPGIITGSILGIGRAAGETAPIMFIAVTFSAVNPSSLWEPVNALSYHILVLATEIPGQEGKIAAGGAALVLLLIVICFYIIAILIRNYYSKKMKW
ncbi:MAG: phosphate ABC transporter permease subunit PstC [Candidatus Thermoplasmatota archaeon]|nr:phosphate ABC transporter permease subunit PstC [Candidatus Thermoplasmatota archaeon]